MLLVVFDLRRLLLAPLQGLATWVLNCFIPVACVCLLNARLCFHTDIIKSTLIHYLCILLLNYSHNSFMCYCIFFLSPRQFELAWLPLLNIPSLKIAFLLINPPSLSFCSNTQCSHVKAVLANFFWLLKQV